MRSMRVLAVAVLAVVMVALPIQSALAGTYTITLNITPTYVVQGQSIRFYGTEDDTSMNNNLSFVTVYTDSSCGVMWHSYGGFLENPLGSGNWDSLGILVTAADYPAGQYFAQSSLDVTIVSPCKPFTVISPTSATVSTSAGEVLSFGSIPTGIVPLSSAPTEAQALSYPYGFFAFIVTGIQPGSTVTLTLTLSQPAEGVQLWKYNIRLAAWQQIPVLSTSGNMVSFQVTDGGTFDEDTIAGQITDPIGAGFPGAGSPIPSGAPVGGFMEPVNKLVVFAPYLALFGVMAVVVVAVAPWKKRENR
jgi:hypothetical protein